MGVKTLKPELIDQVLHAGGVIGVSSLAGAAPLGGIAVAVGMWAFREHAEDDSMLSSGSLRDLSGYAVGALVYWLTSL